MKKLEEFERWMAAGDKLEATYDRETAWAAWSCSWDAAVNEAAEAFWHHEKTVRRVRMDDAKSIVKSIRGLSSPQN